MVHQQAIKIRRESRTSFITKAILYQRVSWIIQVRLLFDRKPWHRGPWNSFEQLLLSGDD